MNWYINKKTNELVQGKLIDEHILSIRIDDYWELKDASQYGEAMICPKKDCKIPDCSSLKPHICNSGCTSPSFCPHCVCYTPEQELSDDELQEPKAGAMEMLLEATNPNCKEKPDSSLLLSEMKAVEKAIELQKYSEDEGYVLMPADYYRAGMVAELDHLAKLGNIFVLVDGEFIFLSRYRDYMKGEGK